MLINQNIYIYVYIWVYQNIYIYILMHIYIFNHLYLYIYIYIYNEHWYKSVYIQMYIYIYIYIYEFHAISFQTFFVWALLLIVHTWNSSPLRNNLIRLLCTFCTVQTTSGSLYGNPLAWACQCPLSQPFSSPQLSHNDCLWA